jgi:L-amino acid N-acyltransferase YncA
MPQSTRVATENDVAAIASIYTQGIEDRTATFQTDPATQARVEQMFALSAGLPLMVAERDAEVVAFAAVSRYSDFAPYAGIGEYAIYVRRDQRRRGVGRELLDALCDESRQCGLHKLTGKLFADNLASIALAHRCGFRDVGVHLRHGRLDGEWKDVLIVERSLDG